MKTESLIRLLEQGRECSAQLAVVRSALTSVSSTLPQALLGQGVSFWLAAPAVPMHVEH